jgi:hypothetical protein
MKRNPTGLSMRGMTPSRVPERFVPGMFVPELFVPEMFVPGGVCR